MSEAQIAVHWREEEYYPPPPSFVAQANAADPAILERFSEERYPDCFVEYAEMLAWDRKWSTYWTRATRRSGSGGWGGRLNASVNCVDRHLESRGDRNALIWAPEREEEETQEITYRELHRRVNEFAALLRDFAGESEPRVTFHLPMVPELCCRTAGVVMAASRWMVTGSWGTTERHNDRSRACAVLPPRTCRGGSAGGGAVRVGVFGPAFGGR